MGDQKKTLLLPRATIDLNQLGSYGLDVPVQTKEFVQKCFDASPLEKKLKAYAHARRLDFTTLTSTLLEPTEQAIVLAEKKAQGECPDIIIFVSKHAAALAKIVLPDLWFKQAQLFSVGQSSQVLFDKEGIEVQSADRESGNGLMSLRALQDLAGKNIIICKGKQGLNDIEDLCKQRGGRLIVLDLYQRVSAHQELVGPIGTVDSVYAVSTFVLKHFLDAQPTMVRGQVKALPLYSMSERIASFAETLGFADIRENIV